MKSFVWFSCAGHMVMLTLLVVGGTLLSKPRMSYYAIDLVSSPPAGGGGPPSPTVTPQTSPAIKTTVPKVAPAPRHVETVEEEAPDEDTIRMLAKLKKKRQATPKSAPRDNYDRSSAMDGPAAPNTGRGGAGLPGSGAGFEASTGGVPFPYPWYMKQIGDKIDKNWKPEQFESNTKCVVKFVINRSGEISGARVSKSSGDKNFDELGLRAVIYSNPMPPLPNGFPDATLTVNLSLTGK